MFTNRNIRLLWLVCFAINFLGVLAALNSANTLNHVLGVLNFVSCALAVLMIWLYD